MTRSSRAELVAAIDLAQAWAIVEAGTSALGSDAGAVALLSRQVDAQAAMLATNQFYALATILMLVSIAVVLLIGRPKRPLTAVTY